MRAGADTFFNILQEWLAARVGRMSLPILGILLCAGTGTAQETALRGRVAATWGDPQAGQPQLLLHVVDAHGRSSRLELPSPMRNDVGALLRLDRAMIDVRGELSITESGSSRLRVTGLQALEAGIAPLVEADARGNGPWAVLLCRFPDVSSTPHSVNWYETLLGVGPPGMVDFWGEVSFGRHDVSGSVVLGWYELPLPRNAYFNGSSPDLNALLKDCTGAADPDLDFGTVTGIHMAFNTDIGGYAWGGSAWMTRDGLAEFYPTTWMPTWADHMTYAHEMGHGIGMPHSSGPYGGTYDSRWDVMSGGYGGSGGTYGRIAMHTIAFHKDRAGWVPSQVKYRPEPDTRSTVRLAHLADDALSGEYSMVEIPLPDGEYYTVEARRDYGYDGPPYEAVVLHRVDPDRSTGVPAHVVDPDGNGNPNDSGAAWLPGETFTDAQNSVRVAVVSQTSSGFEVEIEVGEPGTNPQPSIALTPTTLSYATTEGTNPSDRSFSVRNDGGGALGYTVASNRSWLGLSRTSGSLAAGASQNVTLSVDASGLAAGDYSGTVTVGGNMPNAPQTVAVSVTVSEAPNGPQMAVGPNSLGFQIKGNQAPGRQRFEVRNDGAQALQWTADESASWLSLDNTSGSLSQGASDSVGVEVSITGLEPGTYDGEIILSGNADNAPQTVAVQLKLTKGGVVKLKRGRLTFAGSEEEQPLAKAVILENAGDDSADWSASSNESWVELDSTSGTLEAGDARVVGLSVSVTGLTAGMHTAQVEFAGGDDELPDTLTIELEVSDGPGVAHAPDQVAAELLGDNSALTGAEVHYIDFVGNGNGRFDVGDLRAWLVQTGRLKAAPFTLFSGTSESPAYDGSSGGTSIEPRAAGAARASTGDRGE